MRWKKLLFGWLVKKRVARKLKKAQRFTGCLPSDDDLRDFNYDIKTSLAPSVMLEGWTIKNQGQYASCTAHAVCTCAEILLKQDWSIDTVQKPEAALSEKYNWYKTREYDYVLPQNVGVQLRDALKMAQAGTSPDVLCPYSDLNTKPSFLSEGFASFFRIGEYSRCYTVDDVKASLNNKHPVAFGTYVDEAFCNLNGLDIPKFKGEAIGAHAMAIVGYDDKGFIVCNSWNSSWGLNGKGRLLFEDFNPAIQFEFWSVTSLKRRDQ